MIIQWILQILVATVIGCILGYFFIRIFTKLRVFLFRKRSNINNKKSREFHDIRFNNRFGFSYEDVLKYAPELDVFVSSILPQQFKDSVSIKMNKVVEIYDAICVVEQVDIIKFKQTIENIKNQKSLENID